MSRSIILLLFVTIFFNLEGQQPLSFQKADSLTFSLYSQKKWDELIGEGRRAIESGHDYYYLRMRLGIAFYEKHNYASSAANFRQALIFNANDEIAVEFLFYSYYLSGKTFLAWALLGKYSSVLTERLIKESGIKRNSLYLESYYSNAATDEILTDPENYFTNPEPGSQIVTKYFINNALYASHFTGKKTNYFHSFTNLVKENYLHYFDGVREAGLPDQRIIQYQYYGSLNIFSISGWVFSPSVHFLTTEIPLIYFGSAGTGYPVLSYNIRNYSYVAGTGLVKRGGFFTFGTELNYSLLDKAEQAQGTISITTYPFGNTTFYIGGKVSTVIPLNMEGSSVRYSTGFITGFSLRSRIWFEVSGLFGDMKNYTDNNGLYIYNSSDILNGKLLGTINFHFKTAPISLSLGSGISWYSSEFIPSDGINSFDSNKLTYTNSILTGGFSWNF